MNWRSKLSIIGFWLISGPALAQSAPWYITQKSWTPQHEKNFGEFVARIGQAVEERRCKSVSSCLKSSANPYIKSDPAGLKYYADCADLPYYLRGYFAWKNQLPFSTIKSVKANLGSRDNPQDIKDLRYTKNGNSVETRFDVTTRLVNGKAQYANAIQVLNQTIPGVTFSGSYRIMGEDSALFSDFYPIKLSEIRLGTVIYDPNGHVAIVYKVTDDGRVFYIDAHPDNSLTMGMFTAKFSRSNPLQGAGFKNFRPISLEGAQQLNNGVLVGGKMVGTSNRNLPDYSTEQFYGTHPASNGKWSQGEFYFKGQKYNFYDYVRMSLMKGEAHLDPLRDMQQLTDDICVALKDRVDAVEAARSNGIDKKAHPDRLPYNIYGTEGEWENFATPSRDARLKTAFIDLLSQTQHTIAAYKAGDPSIRYNGGNLARDLYKVYGERATACQFSYKTSAGRTVQMNLEAARLRLFDMSFDPYHCIERRWGARMQEEISSCQDNANKTEWYNAERWLRYQHERSYEARMDLNLQELKQGPRPNVGIQAPLDIDIVNYLKSEM